MYPSQNTINVHVLVQRIPANTATLFTQIDLGGPSVTELTGFHRTRTRDNKQTYEIRLFSPRYQLKNLIDCILHCKPEL